jgi:HAD superfamily hydrolase (TIGR01509 family)
MIALFDFDGVLMDTEAQYTRFWDETGRKFVDMDGFGSMIKGQTLVQIFDKYFADRTEEELRAVEEAINEYERNMTYEFIPGARGFLNELRQAGIPTAIVTSSNNQKMSQVYKAHPDLHTLVDAILTSEHFSKSKPDPECFLKGMEMLGGTPETTVVFEDSIHGITAGRAAGAYVTGLATTNKREVIEPLCDMVIDNFSDFSLKELTDRFSL